MWAGSILLLAVFAAVQLAATSLVDPVPYSSVGFPALTSRAGDDITLHIPEDCLQLGICDKGSSYKDDVVERVIEDFQRQNRSFHSDVLEASISGRDGSDTNNIELCSSTEKLYVPKFAQDDNKQWHRIINTEMNPKQRFRIEICSGAYNGPCSPIAIFQAGYGGSCMQKYVLRIMVALNAKDEVIQKPFKLPSCCVCVAKTV